MRTVTIDDVPRKFDLSGDLMIFQYGIVGNLRARREREREHRLSEKTKNEHDSTCFTMPAEKNGMASGECGMLELLRVLECLSRASKICALKVCLSTPRRFRLHASPSKVEKAWCSTRKKHVSIMSSFAKKNLRRQLRQKP